MTTTTISGLQDGHAACLPRSAAAMTSNCEDRTPLPPDKFVSLLAPTHTNMDRTGQDTGARTRTYALAPAYTHTHTYTRTYLRLSHTHTYIHTARRRTHFGTTQPPPSTMRQVTRLCPTMPNAIRRASAS